MRVGIGTASFHCSSPLTTVLIAVDLPTGDEGAGLAEYADAIVAAAGDANDVTLVAQSMGGFSAPLAVGRGDE